MDGPVDPPPPSSGALRVAAATTELGASPGPGEGEETPRALRLRAETPETEIPEEAPPAGAAPVRSQSSDEDDRRSAPSPNSSSSDHPCGTADTRGAELAMARGKTESDQPVRFRGELLVRSSFHHTHLTPNPLKGLAFP
ncbi:MAG: hypothetical protein ACK41W_00705 [Cyanobacteriota bacterium]